MVEEHQKGEEEGLGPMWILVQARVPHQEGSAGPGFSQALEEALGNFEEAKCVCVCTHLRGRGRGSSNACGLAILESMIKVLAGLVSPEASFLGLQTAALSLCSHMVILLSVCSLGPNLPMRTPVILD